jgi:MoxR-like ATPase
MIYNIKENDFSIKKGPVFANFVLADEINRAPAKVQSALLEAMQERQVTIGDESFALKPPFLVMATQNPVEQEGTYPLPEAQVDRFMLKVIIDYPNKTDERQIVSSQVSGTTNTIKPVVTTAQVIKAQKAVREVYMDEKIEAIWLRRSQTTHQFWGISERKYQHDNRCQMLCLYKTTGICCSRRCSRSGTRCSSSQNWNYLRSRSGKHHFGRHH